MSITHRYFRECIAVVLLVALKSAIPAQTPPATEAKDLSSKLDAFAHSQVAKGFSGGVIVINHDKLILNKEYGLPASRTPTDWA